MSKKIKAETTPQTSVDPIGDTPPTRKRAAKKAATPAPAEPLATKVPTARKVAAKKAAAAEPVAPEAVPKKPAAKRARPKTITATSSPELPFEVPVTVKPTAAVLEVVPPAAKPNPRFGRVPGGGPTAPRDTPSPVSTPFPQSSPAVQRENQAQEGPPADRQPQEGQGQESRSKRRREKRKRRHNERKEQNGQSPQPPQNSPQNPPNPPNRQRFENRNSQGSGRQRQQAQQQQRQQQRQPSAQDSDERRAPIHPDSPKFAGTGMLELAPKGFGFLRLPAKNFEQARDDIFVTHETIRKYNLRNGQWIQGLCQEGQRGPQLVEISTINDLTPEVASKLPHFDELKAINPSKRISFETTPERFTTRVVDIMAPVGRGQRGLIVSPPRSGKTTLLLHMAEAIREKYDEAIHLMVVLVDERPEEVTEFRRALPGVEIYASSNDEQARNHTRIAELAIERAKRLVEAGRDVFLIMDSITRLARAYNGNMNNRGRGTGSGGITIGALEVPRRLFAAARNTRGGGSLTIMATALIQTNSRADEAIYMEFKGTGNMELVLDRKIAENYIYPAVDIFKSGTRREEILLADHMLHKIHLIRRGLSGHRPAEAMERLLFFLKKFPNNPQMLLEIKG
jgi:transcription termination factor Rho